MEKRNTKEWNEEIEYEKIREHAQEIKMGSKEVQKSAWLEVNKEKLFREWVRENNDLFEEYCDMVFEEEYLNENL